MALVKNQAVLIALVMLLAGPMPAATGKAPKGPELTPADQTTIDNIKAADQWISNDEGAVRWSLDRSPGGNSQIDLQGEEVIAGVLMPSSTDPAKKMRFRVGWAVLKSSSPKPKLLELADEMDLAPVIVDGKPLILKERTAYSYDGVLREFGTSEEGLEVTREVFPCRTTAVLIERWSIKNSGHAAVTLAAEPQTIDLEERSDSYVNGTIHQRRQKSNDYPVFKQTVWSDALAKTALAPGKSATVCKYLALYRKDVARPAVDAAAEFTNRDALRLFVKDHFRLETPDPILNQTLRMSALRLLESPMQTIGGVMQTTGGLKYFPGLWANDNVEYAGPVFPLIGHARSLKATENMYRVWLDDPENFSGKFAPEDKSLDGKHLQFNGSYEGYQLVTVQSSRGDDAMMLYGLGLFLLNEGDPALAERFYRLLKQAEASIQSNSDAKGLFHTLHDELEGRYPSGKANLANNSLAYGGYTLVARLANALGKTGDATDFEAKAQRLRAVIESHFGAKVEGFDTYRYFVGEPWRRGGLRADEQVTQDVLRGWICMPLVVGIYERQQGTLAAIFSDKLWLKGRGLKPASTDQRAGWPRQTYYALLAAFRAGAADRAYRELQESVRQGMCGAGGPYLSEDGGDLLSPHALYIRALTEGLFGIDPLSLDKVCIAPSMPSGWERMAWRNIRLCGRTVDIEATHSDGKIVVRLRYQGKPVEPSSESKDGKAVFDLTPFRARPCESTPENRTQTLNKVPHNSYGSRLRSTRPV